VTWSGERGDVEFLRRAITVPGAGHFSALERPEEMVGIIRQGRAD
jgi:pimeloyl-ACP methyl ester carboxylesterase